MNKFIIREKSATTSPIPTEGTTSASVELKKPQKLKSASKPPTPLKRETEKNIPVQKEVQRLLL